jgi:site-specific DNA recombinase
LAVGRQQRRRPIAPLAARMAQDAGLVYRKSGAKVPVSTIHSILRTRLYTGWFEWNGKMVHGRHAPLFSVEL